MGECKCGENEECSGNTDTCVMGECKCGENEECSNGCTNGECIGILGIRNSIFKRNIQKYTSKFLSLIMYCLFFNHRTNNSQL